jgi:hypothetical protein
MPTQKPLMMRPTMSMGMFWAAETMIQPMTQLSSGQHVSTDLVFFLPSYMTAPTMMAFLRPRLSERIPETSEASQEPPAILREDQFMRGLEGEKHVRSSDSTLYARSRAGALLDALIEVAEVRIGGDDGRHAADIETEEATSNDGDGGDEVDIAELPHDGRWWWW